MRNAQSRLDELMNMLGPYFVVLSPPERQSLLKMGRGSFKFAELAYGLAVEHPELFPGFLKAGILGEDFSIARELWALAAKLNQLKDRLQDTELAAGNYALQAAFSFYQTVKIAAKRDIPGASVIYEELKSRRPSWQRKQPV